MQLRKSSAVNASNLIMWSDTSHVCTPCKVDRADRSASKSSSSSGSNFSDFETSMEGENNERALEPVGKIRPWRFQSPGRNESRASGSEEDQEPVLRGRLKKESDEWWVHYICKYCIWQSVAPRLQNIRPLITIWIRCIVIKVSFLKSRGQYANSVAY